jgi:importin subunit alpha-6/7
MIDINEVLEKIGNLRSHDNSEIHEKAVKILKTYWFEDEDEDETLPPGNGSQPGFNYGGSDLQAPPDRFYFSRM